MAAGTGWCRTLEALLDGRRQACRCGLRNCRTMADDEVTIEDALAPLADEDPGAARHALAALEWMTGEGGLEGLTQERVQNFVWYELATKWMTDYEEKVAVVDAVGRALDLLDRPRYAVICRSPTTIQILEAYERSYDDGRTAFQRAYDKSGINPPDLDDFEWGATMGLEEAMAMSSTAGMLEEAVAGGQLVPCARGWKSRQQELTQVHLDLPRIDHAGQSLRQLIHTERIGCWLGTRRSETRPRTLAPVADRLQHPAPLPPSAAADPLPLLSWLLGQLERGLSLTQTGNLHRGFVQAAASRFGWDFERPRRRRHRPSLARPRPVVDGGPVRGSQLRAH
jgi:hypothetical protein